jgi:hypothetical protein
LTTGGAFVNNLDYLAQTYPDSVLQLGIYLVDIIDPIYDGMTDKRIEDFLDNLERYQRPVFLRFGYEFDGPWNLYEREKHINAWRTITNKIYERGIDHVEMIWQSATHCDGIYGGTPLSA